MSYDAALDKIRNAAPAIERVEKARREALHASRDAEAQILTRALALVYGSDGTTARAVTHHRGRLRLDSRDTWIEKGRPVLWLVVDGRSCALRLTRQAAAQDTHEHLTPYDAVAMFPLRNILTSLVDALEARAESLRRRNGELRAYQARLPELLARLTAAVVP